MFNEDKLKELVLDEFESVNDFQRKLNEYANSAIQLSTIYFWLNGKRKPRAENIQNIAGLTKKNMEYFMS